MALPPDTQTSELTVLSPEQQQNARAIYDVGVQMGMDEQTIAAAISTAAMESRLKNINYGDRDSLGLFQQRANWGTAKERTTPAIAARKFFEAYTKAKGSTVLERIANTQRPEAKYRSRYADYFSTAQAAVSAITGRPAPTLTGAPAAPGAMVRAAGAGPAAVAPASTGPAAPALPPNATPAQIEHYIQVNFPQAAPFLANPEIRKILLTPGIADMDEIAVEAALRKTDYWRTHGPASRAFDAALARDHDAAIESVAKAKNVIADIFGREGLTGDDNAISGVAQKAIRAGWIDLDGQVTNAPELDKFTAWALGQQAHGGPLPTGETANSETNLASIAKGYLVPLASQQLDKWALDIRSGVQTQESFTSWVRGLSKAHFSGQPEVQAAIDKGIAPADYFQSNVATAAKLLELDPNQIDLTDPKWADLTEIADPKTGQRRAPTWGEVDKIIRQRPEFADKRAYKAQAGDLNSRLDAFFGTVA